MFHTHPGKTEGMAVPSREGIGNMFHKAEFLLRSMYSKELEGV
jgi:hypothetical protein